MLSEKTDAHSRGINSVAFSPDGTKIVSGSADGTIKVWDAGALLPSNQFALDKTDACAGLSGRHDGAVEREDKRPQRQDLLCRVFPGRDQDRVRIGGQDDQSLGFRCAASPQIAPHWPKLTLAGLSGRQAGDAEREDERAQRLRHVGGVLPGRDQDCVGIVGQDDQSLGFRCVFTLKSHLLGQN